MSKRSKQKHQHHKEFPFIVWKAGITLLLLFLMLFLCTHFDEYRKNASDQVNKYRVDQACLLSDDVEVMQRFVATHTHLKTVKIYFSNDYGSSAKGQLIFKIQEDESQKIVKKMTVNISELLNNEYTEFNTNVQLKKGRQYYIILKTKNAESGKEPIVYQWKTKQKGFNQRILLNGEKGKKRFLVAKFYFPVTIYAQWMGICLIILGVIVLVWCDIALPFKIKKYLGYLMFYATPAFTFWFVERFTNNSISRIHIILVLLNLLVYYIFFTALYLLVVSRRAAVGLNLLIWFILGVANYFVLAFKGAPIVPSDIMSASTAASVAENYTYTIQPIFIWNGLLILLYFALFFRLPIETKTGWKKRILMLALVLASSTILGNFVVEERTLKSIGVKNNVWDQKKGYAKNGFFFGFVLNMNSLVQEKPSDYSVEAAKDIAHKYEEKYSNQEKTQRGRLETKDGKKPNMIFIMNEAFSDLTTVGDFETNQDAMPFIRELTKNTIRGRLYMSIFGSGTCNSEFEFLTGNSMSFLQSGIIAYTQIVKGKLPNVTYQMKSQGYGGNEAMHPYLATGWNRPQIYDWMGFEKFYSEEDFDNPKMYRKYISDESNMKMIMKMYEKRKDKKKPFYMFNVTMQNHGGFDKVYSNFENNVLITDSHQNDQAEQYLSLIKKTDEAFKELVNYFKKVKEPTIIVMFGDHQPAVTSKFYDSILQGASGSLTPEETMKKYQTPFIVWANYDIKETTIDKMSANYLSAYVMKEAGLKTSAYQDFLLELYEDMPVITAMGAYDKEGNFYESALDSPYADKVKEYQILQYNNLIDIKNTVNSFFYVKKTKR